MAELLGISSGIVGLVVPALHGARLLLTDIQKIIDAPGAIKRLGEDVDSVRANLALLQNIEESAWASLGTVVVDHSKGTITNCELACDTIRGDIQRWTKRSQGGKLSWQDRVTVGFFKEHHLEAACGQMQTYKMTLSSLVGTATLYSSMRNAHLTEEIRDRMTSQQTCTESAVKSSQTRVAVVQRTLAEVQSSSSKSSTGEEDTDVETAVMQVEALIEVLKSSQTLLNELLLKSQTAEVEKVCAASAPTKMYFGKNDGGMQTGINHGSITWNSGR
ncbi:hypothetical protein K431DRAFT_224660 [Polychaeton citri CBS 116435]|uniref:Azaphilone pigments biosynthesis cluster protein L N-terminal domain-containing protein n=1 Tax=Polychaeton citri CBS 116435 TaxID=1314669 RepID=A0A9P4UQ70_9PEZI|nr:hypothetical protein K431DRAFT_224660 [Polychaeton citri CBS 116435]